MTVPFVSHPLNESTQLAVEENALFDEYDCIPIYDGMALKWRDSPCHLCLSGDFESESIDADDLPCVPVEQFRRMARRGPSPIDSSKLSVSK